MAEIGRTGAKVDPAGCEQDLWELDDGEVRSLLLSLL